MGTLIPPLTNPRPLSIRPLPFHPDGCGQSLDHLNDRPSFLVLRSATLSILSQLRALRRPSARPSPEFDRIGASFTAQNLL
jgi:hypothetical protein